MDQTLNPTQELAGIWHLAAWSVTRQRLSLGLDGSFRFENYQDLGGRWFLSNRGRFLPVGDSVHFLPEFRSPARWEISLLMAPMHLRRVGPDWLLVPDARVSDGARLADFDAELAGARERYVYLEHGWYSFLKAPLPAARLCIDARSYAHALTPGKAYLVLEARDESLRLYGDHGRLRWFPAACFAQPEQGP